MSFGRTQLRWQLPQQSTLGASAAAAAVAAATMRMKTTNPFLHKTNLKVKQRPSFLSDENRARSTTEKWRSLGCRNTTTEPTTFLRRSGKQPLGLN